MAGFSVGGAGSGGATSFSKNRSLLAFSLWGRYDYRWRLFFERRGRRRPARYLCPLTDWLIFVSALKPTLKVPHKHRGKRA